MTRKLIFAIIFTLLISTISHRAFAYRLPPCSVADDEWQISAEEVLLKYMTAREELASEVDTARLEEHRRNSKIRLTAGERKVAQNYDDILVKIKFWEEVAALKDSLSALHGTHPPKDAVVEADAMAKEIIDTLYALSQKWRIGSALFTNFLINLGMKDKGFCYHYAANLRKALMKRSWNRFDLHWGAAWEFTFRESNAMIITAKGRPFEEGLAVDPWRTAGKPFWTPVKGDRFPWVEGFNIEEKYEVD